ncbi:MAG: MobC family plasmid mobilization relaxosome protein [Ruminococcus sp.]|nr:MobC family plasmid mobilization relaxosome protein [Ruminococcus sp.]
MKENRNCIMKFRATEEEKTVIMRKVIDAGMNISEYLRSAALDKPVMNISGLDEIAHELRAIGNNLNQITRAVNSGYIQAVNLHETEEVLGQLWQLLNSLRQSVQ